VPRARSPHSGHAHDDAPAEGSPMAVAEEGLHGGLEHSAGKASGKVKGSGAHPNGAAQV
jgi:hypothetical protein